MDKCSCGTCCTIAEYDKETESWLANTRDILVLNFCPYCGSQLLPDGRVIQRETIPNKLMDMLKEVQATCPESGLQEFALKCFNWIEELREQAGLTQGEVMQKAGFADQQYSHPFLHDPGAITLGGLLTVINAAQKAQEATK